MSTDLFAQIAAAAPAATPAGRLVAGTHVLALTRCALDLSRLNQTIVVADFTVLRSDVLAQLDHVQRAWFIESDNFTGTYEQQRCKEFIYAAARAVEREIAVDDTKAFVKFATQLTSGEHDGLVIRADVRRMLDGDGNPRFTKRGLEVLNTTWTTVALDDELRDLAAQHAERRAVALAESGADEVAVQRWLGRMVP